MSKGEGNVTKVVTTKEYYKDTGEITSVTFIDNKDGETTPRYTEYRETDGFRFPGFQYGKVSRSQVYLLG
jgi:hypothetical protein